MRRGLVIGKFRPPHRGHKFLIDEAAHRCDALVVLVLADTRDYFSGEERAAWLREMVPSADVRLVVGDVPESCEEHDTDARLECLALIRAAVPEPIDVLFSSASYGGTVARWLECDHEAIDPHREHYAISTAMIRERPVEGLAYVSPSVRAAIVPRIIVVGAESTGKTTLSRALAERYDTLWIGEYGRDYTVWLGQRADHPVTWTDDDFVAIAREQQLREDAAARQSQPVLLCDTDVFATMIWYERYRRMQSPPLLDRPLPGRRFYLHAESDVPFVQDGLRDGEHIRSWMSERFRVELTANDYDHITLSGDWESRAVRALEAVERAMSQPIPLFA